MPCLSVLVNHGHRQERKVCPHLALGAEVAAQAHRDGTSNQLCEAAEYHNPRVAQGRQAGRQGERHRQAVGEAYCGIRDDASIDREAVSF